MPVRLDFAAFVFLLSVMLTQFMIESGHCFCGWSDRDQLPQFISTRIRRRSPLRAAIGCSASFLTPMAHPVNLIVMSPGNYRFGDFFRVGWGLTIVVFLALLAGMILFWRL